MQEAGRDGWMRPEVLAVSRYRSVVPLCVAAALGSSSVSIIFKMRACFAAVTLKRSLGDSRLIGAGGCLPIPPCVVCGLWLFYIQRAVMYIVAGHPHTKNNTHLMQPITHIDRHLHVLYVNSPNTLQVYIYTATCTCFMLSV